MTVTQSDVCIVSIGTYIPKKGLNQVIFRYFRGAIRVHITNTWIKRFTVPPTQKRDLRQGFPVINNGNKEQSPDLQRIIR